MKASYKDPNYEAVLTEFTGVDRVKSIENMECTTCDSPNTEFKDELSRKEYTISGMCQNCQDKVFG